MIGRTRRRILLAVTTQQSLRLLEGFPSFLARQGWDVHVVCDVAPHAKEKGVSFHSLPMRREPSAFQDLRALFRWLTLLGCLRPSIVVAGTPKAGLLGTVAAFLTRRPIRIYLLRGLRLATETGVRRELLAILERVAGGLATRVQAVSPSLADEVIELGLVPPDKLTVVGSGSSNGVLPATPLRLAPSPAQRRAALGIADFPTIGFVGRIHPDKGVDTLMRAFRQLLDRGTRAQLLLVGNEEPPGYLNEVLDQAMVHPRHVHWVGPVEDPGKYYRAMEVLCLPTKREGFPNVVLEAAVHGVPCVASRVTGCADAILDGTTGILVEPGNASDFADGLDKLLRDPTYRQLLGLAALRRANVDFGRQQVWRLTEAFYKGELQGHDKRSAHRRGMNIRIPRSQDGQA